MTIDQIIEAAKHWRLNRNTAEIAKYMGLQESQIANNMWRITRVAERSVA